MVVNRYAAILERIFSRHYHAGDRVVEFHRREIEEVAGELGIPLPKNLGDLIYSFRYRYHLPESIQSVLQAGEKWVIRPAGKSVYRLEISELSDIHPSKHYAEIRIPDATPGVIGMYALSDEQALLAILRYNRLVDVFLHITCYSLQSHLRTHVRGMGQVETDELYVGLDRNGAHFIVPVQAKGGRDVLNIVQIEQDFAVCQAKFPNLICRPVAAQFMAPDLIALFEFGRSPEGIVRVRDEKHYRLVPGPDIDPDEIAGYRAAAARPA